MSNGESPSGFASLKSLLVLFIAVLAIVSLSGIVAPEAQAQQRASSAKPVPKQAMARVTKLRSVARAAKANGQRAKQKVATRFRTTGLGRAKLDGLKTNTLALTRKAARQVRVRGRVAKRKLAKFIRAKAVTRGWKKWQKTLLGEQRMVVIAGTRGLPKEVLRQQQGVLKFVASANGKRAATAFVVQHDSDGTSLILTNHHVMNHGSSSEHFIELGDGSRVRPLKTVASDKSLDYALVRVPTSASLSRVSTIHLANGAASGAIYSIGFPNAPKLARDGNLGHAELSRVFASGTSSTRSLLKEQPKTIQMGITGRAETVYQGKSAMVDASLPGFHGSSGSPVFNAEHQLVGLMVQGASGAVINRAKGKVLSGAWSSSYVTTQAIHSHLAVTQGQRAGSSRRSVERLLSGTRPARLISGGRRQSTIEPASDEP
ncbi:MAG: trypsin-like peptidase domain-containing protein [Myxococcales bacterium]|nr:trypsin-like peptidase domain-containing protein [Myxococcales bacterium]